MKTLVKNQTALGDAIRLAEIKPSAVAPLPDYKDGVPIVYRAICYFHFHDYNLPVRVNSFAFHENRYVDILEDKNGQSESSGMVSAAPALRAEARFFADRKTTNPDPSYPKSALQHLRNSLPTLTKSTRKTKALFTFT